MNEQIRELVEQTNNEINKLSLEVAPVAWMYTLEYGVTTVDTKVSLHQLRYPFGVCGSDYLRANDDGVSYVRETPLYPRQKPKDQNEQENS